MNRKPLFFLAVLSIAVVACSKDEDQPQINHPIIGTWVQTSYTVSGCTDESSDYAELEGCNETTCYKIQYKSNGIVIHYDTYDGITDDESAKFTLDTEENTVLACETSDDCGDLQTFTIDGTTLTLVSEDLGNGCTTTIVLERE